MASKEHFYTISTAMLLLFAAPLKLIHWEKFSSTKIHEDKERKKYFTLSAAGCIIVLFMTKASFFFMHVCKICIWRIEICIKNEVKNIKHQKHRRKKTE